MKKEELGENKKWNDWWNSLSETKELFFHIRVWKNSQWRKEEIVFLSFFAGSFFEKFPIFCGSADFSPFYALLFIPDVFDDVFDDPFVMGVGFDQIFDLL